MLVLSALLFCQLAVLLAVGNVVLAAGYLRSLVALIVAFLISALVWVMVGADFLGLILVLVYVGAVLVLFLFVLMMLRLESMTPFDGGGDGSIGLGWYSLFVLSAWIATSVSIWSEGLPSAARDAGLMTELDSIKAVGVLLYGDYPVAFIASSLVLTTAAVAAIYLTREPWDDETGDAPGRLTGEVSGANSCGDGRPSTDGSESQGLKA